MATTSLKLPDELKQRVNALAALANKSPHAFMLEAIEQEARRGEKYQQFLAQAETSWQEYQSNVLRLRQKMYTLMCVQD